MRLQADPSTQALIVELHRRLAQELVQRLREPNPPAELLAIARTFCMAFGQGFERDDEQRRMLTRLQRLHLRKLLEAITDPERRPTASMLAEVRQVLASAPMTDLQGDLKAREEAVKLIKAGLPFSTAQ